MHFIHQCFNNVAACYTLTTKKEFSGFGDSPPISAMHIWHTPGSALYSSCTHNAGKPLHKLYLDVQARLYVKVLAQFSECVRRPECVCSTDDVEDIERQISWMLVLQCVSLCVFFLLFVLFVCFRLCLLCNAFVWHAVNISLCALSHLCINTLS